MKDNFLESDFFSKKRIALFGINRIQSRPTITQVKDVDIMYDQFTALGIDSIHFVSICDFLLFDPMMAKLAPRCTSTQLDDTDEITQLQQFLGKKGHHRFLKEYWQFAAIVNNGQLEYYIEQPFKEKLGPDTRVNIYGEISPSKVLDYLTNKSV